MRFIQLYLVDAIGNNILRKRLTLVAPGVFFVRMMLLRMESSCGWMNILWTKGLTVGRRQYTHADPRVLEDFHLVRKSLSIQHVVRPSDICWYTHPNFLYLAPTLRPGPQVDGIVVLLKPAVLKRTGQNLARIVDLFPGRRAPGDPVLWL